MSQTVDRALSILPLLAEGPADLGQVADRLGVHKSTALRLLRTLHEHGMVYRQSDQRYRLGTTPIAVPVTETERIPSWDEVATVQTISRRLDDYVPLVDPVIDWAKIEAMRDRLVLGGRRFYEAAIGGLSSAGIDARMAPMTPP